MDVSPELSEDEHQPARVLQAELNYRTMLTTLPVAWVLSSVTLVPFYLAQNGFQEVTWKVAVALHSLAFISAAWYVVHIGRYRRSQGGSD